MANWNIKRCAVPKCNNTTVKNPDKLFIHVSKGCPERRQQWLQLAGRDPKSTSNKSTIFFCEDHFDLPNDMENYIQYNIMGAVSKIKMKPDCVPSRFECQSRRKKRKEQAPPEMKSQRKDFIEEICKQSETRAALGITSNSGNIPSGILKVYVPVYDKVEPVCESGATEPPHQPSYVPSVGAQASPNDEKDWAIAPTEPGSTYLQEQIKKEPGSPVFVKEEINEEEEIKKEVEIKKEEMVGEEWGCGVSEAAGQAGLYVGHTVKGELVLGPELLQTPDIAQQVSGASASQPSGASEANDECPGEGPHFKDSDGEQQALTTCSVGLQHEQSPAIPQQNAASKRFICNICKKSYLYKKNLNKHRKEKHGPYDLCDVCRKRFSDKTKLKEHRTQKHNCCDVCDKRFYSTHGLKVHQRSHTGEEPYRCGICNEGFSLKLDLWQHRKVHRGGKHVCNLCNKIFLGNLFCSHIRINMGERPFTCKVCERRFIHKSSLVKHATTHRGES